ncbi:hypothetical protein H4S06_004114 [Coemansia sp. BCRC 34490]|nr:hypothetical protein H4S06_004114 [Coemansia sp. BCRC 34490]
MMHTFLVLLAVLALSAVAASQGQAGEGEGQTKANAECLAAGVADWNRGLQIGGVFIVLGISAAGVMLPVGCRYIRWLDIDKRILCGGKFFGAGVIMATAFVHMLGESVEALKDDCLDGRMGDYESWPGALAMMAVLAMHLIEHVVSARFVKLDEQTAAASDSDSTGNSDVAAAATLEEKKSVGKSGGHFAGGGGGGHVHGLLVPAGDQARRRLSTYMLELGIALHSIIIGMTLAVTGGSAFTTLLAAISVHQFFEGVALGTRIAELSFRRNAAALALANCAVFAITTPLGQAIGIGIRESFAPRDPATLVILGVLNSLSAGVLIYSALVNLLAEEFSAPDFRASPRWTRIAYFVAMYAGCATMSVIGKWT